MKVFVTGCAGQLGYDVLREGKKRGHDMVGSDMIGEDVIRLDITNLDAVYQVIQDVKPDAIIHCAAYTAVDKSEDDRELCWKVNVDGTSNLAKAAKEIGAKLLYISTDYVYDGEGDKPFVETDEPAPVGYYGLTKLEGEKAVQAVLSDWYIVRISWVFGLNGHNFVKTMLKLAETKAELSVVGDQIGSPTNTADLSRLLVDMIETNRYGIYQATNEGFCSWADFAKEIFKIAEKNVKVSAITTEEYPTRAVRPKNSRMSKQKLVDCGFVPLPSWQDSLKQYIKDLQEMN